MADGLLESLEGRSKERAALEWREGKPVPDEHISKVNMEKLEALRERLNRRFGSDVTLDYLYGISPNVLKGLYNTRQNKIKINMREPMKDNVLSHEAMHYLDHAGAFNPDYLPPKSDLKRHLTNGITPLLPEATDIRLSYPIQRHYDEMLARGYANWADERRAEERLGNDYIPQYPQRPSEALFTRIYNNELRDERGHPRDSVLIRTLRGLF